MENFPIKSVTFGGFDKQDVIRYIEQTALSNDEYGTEAAAVTAIMLAGGAMVPEQTVEMVVDRPFYFTITDYKNGVNLFEGCVFYPES